MKYAIAMMLVIAAACDKRQETAPTVAEAPPVAAPAQAPVAQAPVVQAPTAPTEIADTGAAVPTAANVVATTRTVEQ
jgi:hypothetical protein